MVVACCELMWDWLCLRLFSRCDEMRLCGSHASAIQNSERREQSFSSRLEQLCHYYFIKKFKKVQWVAVQRGVLFGERVACTFQEAWKKDVLERSSISDGAIYVIFERGRIYLQLVQVNWNGPNLTKHRSFSRQFVELLTWVTSSQSSEQKHNGSLGEFTNHEAAISSHSLDAKIHRKEFRDSVTRLSTSWVSSNSLSELREMRVVHISQFIMNCPNNDDRQRRERVLVDAFKINIFMVSI